MRNVVVATELSKELFKFVVFKKLASLYSTIHAEGPDVSRHCVVM